MSRTSRGIRFQCIKKITTIFIAVLAVYSSVGYLRLFSIRGNSMSPSLENQDIVLVLKGKNIQRSDVVAFELGDLVLVKRVIACGGDVIQMGSMGEVFVNGELIEEDYVANLSLGESCSIEFPYIVPHNHVFVMGDNRESSIDSRTVGIGAVNESDIVGKVMMLFS